MFHSSKLKNSFLKVVWHKQGPRAIVKNGEQAAEMPSSKLLGLGFYFLFNTSHFNLHLEIQQATMERKQTILAQMPAVPDTDGEAHSTKRMHLRAREDPF